MSEFKFKRFVNFLAFCFVILVGIMLVVAKLVPSVKVLKNLADYLAYFVLIVSAYFYVRSTKNWVVNIIFIIFLALIITFLIIF